MKNISLKIPSAWAAVVLFCFACGTDEAPLNTQSQFDPLVEQSALVTATRVEPDQSWDGGIAARDISWEYISFTQLRNSISVVGAFKITFVNTNADRDTEADVQIRFVGADGFLHIPLTPLNKVQIPAGNTILVRENFVVEVKDPSTANEISRLSIVVF